MKLLYMTTVKLYRKAYVQIYIKLQNMKDREGNISMVA